MSWLMKAPCVAPSDLREGVDWTQPAVGLGYRVNWRRSPSCWSTRASAALMVGLLRRATASNSAREIGAGPAGAPPSLLRGNTASELPGVAVGSGNAGGSPPPACEPTMRLS